MTLPDLYADLSWRGLIHQCTDAAHVARCLMDAQRTVYAGFDPTADSLHVGSLLPLMLLRRFQKAGHRPLALVGGATGMIGDPSGKSEERNLLDLDSLKRNVDGIGKQMERLLEFDGPAAARLVNNFDWMREFSFLTFLRDIGKNFPVNVMLSKESVKNRLEREDGGLSYTEFSYMLLQAYDFVHLHRAYGCELQIGGSDQWGNITAGIDLARRMHGAHLHGMTCPLLTKSDGSKMGKTERGAIWLSPDRTRPYEFFQYWMNLGDDDVGKCLRFLTELGREEIEGLDALRETAPQARDSQRRLAEELTRLVHGEDGLLRAVNATAVFFGAEINDLADQELVGIFADVASKTLARDRLTGEGLNILDALMEASLAKSKGEARRTVQQGGAYVNNRRVVDENTMLNVQSLASETIMVLRTGKRNYGLLRFPQQ